MHARQNEAHESCAHSQSQNTSGSGSLSQPMICENKNGIAPKNGREVAIDEKLK